MTDMEDFVNQQVKDMKIQKSTPKDCADYANLADFRLKKLGIEHRSILILEAPKKTDDPKKDTHCVVVVDLTDQITNLKGWKITKIVKKE
ncbi:hypothetical protein [Sulfuricurvum sp.]|uniref:hypothetical protein n=1 Tax=Sulfuricurvum sp. TaxID=2025608 RepID=UPI00356AFA5F